MPEMKDYTIWLTSGDFIAGRVDADTAAHLLVEFRRRWRKREYSFYDTDGITSLDMRKVLAIGFNKIVCNKTGF